MKKTENEFLYTLKQNELEPVQEIIEIGIDQALSDSLLKDIPIISTIAGVYNTVLSIRENFFLKKMLVFLYCLSEIPADDRSKMIMKLEADDDYKHKVGEHLLTLLDRLDHHRKSAWLGLAFKAYCQEQINSIQFQRLCSAIDKVLIHDIDLMEKFSVKEPMDVAYEGEVAQNFINASLASTQSGWGTSGISQPTQTCKLFV